jgi:hypothetical protein
MTLDDALTTAAAQYDEATLPMLRLLEQRLHEAGIDPADIDHEMAEHGTRIAEGRARLLVRVDELAR